MMGSVGGGFGGGGGDGGGGDGGAGGGSCGFGLDGGDGKEGGRRGVVSGIGGLDELEAAKTTPIVAPTPTTKMLPKIKATLFQDLLGSLSSSSGFAPVLEFS